MQAYRKIRDEIAVNTQMKMLTQAYQEHAIVQINLARYSVVSSREFMAELAEIFYNVKSSYETYLHLQTGHNKKLLLSKLEKNGKDVFILLSSNGKFYGDIVGKICKAFVLQARTTQADLVIVGNEGRKFYEESGVNKPFAYFELPDTNITLDMLKPLIEAIIGYKKATIFYGKFDNIIVQEPVESSLTGDITTEKANKEKNESYLFEPSIENVMEFFESQIFSMLLNQTVNESKLARFASRIKAMEFAQNNLLRQLTRLTSRERRIRSMEMNKKQLQLFAGRSLWNKKLSYGS